MSPETVKGAHTSHLHDREVLGALVAFHRDSGNRAAARHYAEKLHALSP